MKISVRQPQTRVSAYLSLLLLQVVAASIRPTNADERVGDKIYTVLQSNHYCSRRMNATHQVGCQSELGGNEGVVWIVEDQSDLDHVLKTGPTPPYMAILKRNFLSRKTIIDFKDNPGRISGVVFLDTEHDDSKSRSIPFSPDDRCPNRYSGLYSNDSQFGDCKHPWQEESPVSGLLYEDIPFPIFLINEKKSIDSIQSCFKEHNVIVTKLESNEVSEPIQKQSTYPLCGLQLDSFMMAAKDTHFCLNGHFLIDELLQTNSRRCYPVEVGNVFAYYKTATGPLHPTSNPSILKPDVAEAESVVLLVTKLSSISMFTEISPGADSTLTSIITLLAVAEALGRVKNSTDVVKSKRNIAFAILDSEPFDYTGSSQMVHRMLQGAFPYSAYYDTNESIAIQNLNLSSLDYIINLDQMANYPMSEAIFFHSDPNDSHHEKLDKIFKVMKRLASSEKVNLERSSNTPLPPASVQEFIKRSRTPDNRNNRFAGLVLSNYDKTYKNLLYHSIYDDAHNVYQTSKSKLLQHLVQVSQLIAKSVYEITFQTDKSDIVTVDKNIVDQLLDCYLKDAQCHLFTRACRAGQRMPSGPVPTYKDPTKRSDDVNYAIAGNLLTSFIGDRVDFNYSKCREENINTIVYNYQFINDKNEPIDDVSMGVCLRSQVLMLTSDSPAYSIRDDEIVLNSDYPAWTVSLNSIRNPVRLYLIPSPWTQWCLFLLGVIFVIASFVVIKNVRISDASSNIETSTATPT